ncbi:carboxypeptidase regulatory-like domain-containing protein [Variovorax sp. PAMC28562]|uniref:Ig-like domain-containing protein n=1 Tax=Variovorax sp. PAMC28562 TaxID=2762323 RepID=UPI00164E03DC|nr:Ig-like domain-containing protein [Variovorax sp. PAMC28562]QNK75331.1 carboxypeptidase regulatory-like domain-containing protein [Variovorax sp. PAMC28562]
MQPHTLKIKAGLTTALLLSLAACGGGGGGSVGFAVPTTPPATTAAPAAPVTETTTTPPTLAKLDGVAATGAAFAGATVTVVDQTGTTVCTTTTDAAGAFSCTLPATTKAPLAIKASRDDHILYSTTASAAGGIANVTPLTTIIVSQLSPDGNPASLAGAIQTNPSSVTTATIQTQVAELVAALKPLLDALGQGAIDVMAGGFTANGTGQDKVLDAISVSVQPNGSSANIEITVKTIPTSDGAAPVSIAFNTADTATTPTLPPIAASAVASTPTPAVVAALFDRLTACYALPLTQRVGGSGALAQGGGAVTDTTNATGTAVNVIAPACKTLFVGDDPATFYNNGYAVGRDSSNNGSFTGIFRQGATGVTFDRGNFEFVRSSGDFVLSYRTIDRFGGTDNDTIIARNVDGVLKLVGNNYAYRASVRPYSEDRELVNTPNFSSFTTGYNISIDNKTVSNASIFSKVEVTSPFSATKIVFYPQSGLSFLALSKDGTNTAGQVISSSIVRLGGEFQNKANSASVSAAETGIYFVSPSYTEAQISAIQNQSVWQLEFFPTSGPSVIQTYRTVSRAQTIGEIRQLAFVQATPVQKAELIAGTSAAGRYTFGVPSVGDPNIIDFSSEGNLDAWMLPAGALAPTSFSVIGRVAGPGSASFNDSTGLTSTQRKAIIYCSSQGSADLHCDPTLTTQYANGSSFHLLELWARSSRQVEVSKKLALYKLQ